MLAQCLFNIFRFAQVPRVSSCGGYCIKLFLLLLLVVLLLVLSEYYCILSTTTTTSTTSTTTSATSTAAAATTFTFINNAFFPHIFVWGSYFWFFFSVQRLIAFARSFIIPESLLHIGKFN